MDIENCGTCLYFKVRGAILGTVCRRYPPALREGHPQVNALDFCGEYVSASTADDEITGEEIAAIREAVQDVVNREPLGLKPETRALLVSFLAKVKA